ncbi:MAG TPA: DUF4398 domain-containing protein [Polyangiaceae bacterium]|nr:DUF4398 domain-containing protein [Polyangiaceae bacterium]
MRIFARWLLPLAALSAGSLGCASRPPPSDHLATAIAAVYGAQVAGAAQVPEAALQLKLAEEQVAQARRMMDRGDNERADYMTLRAFNDAELAVALTRAHEAKVRADEVTKNIAKEDATEEARRAPEP